MGYLLFVYVYDSLPAEYMTRGYDFTQVAEDRSNLFPFIEEFDDLRQVERYVEQAG